MAGRPEAATFFAGIFLGTLLGAGLVAAWTRARRGAGERTALELFEAWRRDQLVEIERREAVLRETVRDVVDAASAQALSRNSRSFLELASARLDRQTERGDALLESKRQAIGSDLSRLTEQLGKLERVVGDYEKDRAHKFGELSQAIAAAAARTESLRSTTEQLQRALASTSARGRWGEHMAENVLALLGLREGIDFEKQRTTDDGVGRPDFTFRLPKGLAVNMDVKFPFDNYQLYLSAETEAARESAARAFLADVRARVREVTGRSYVDPRGGTVDYVLVFIPNEQVFAFIQEREPALTAEAFRRKVILCSPFTLYALLSVIRQAVGIFALEQRSEEILHLLADLRRSWESYCETMDKMGRRLDDAQQEYRRLATTRRSRVDRTLEKVRALEEAADTALAASEDALEDATG